MRYPALSVGIFKNNYLIAAVGFSLAVLLTLVYVPLTIPGMDMTLQDLTHTVYIEPWKFLLIACVSSIGFIYLELAKWWHTKAESI